MTSDAPATVEIPANVVEAAEERHQRAVEDQEAAPPLESFLLDYIRMDVDADTGTVTVEIQDSY